MWKVFRYLLLALGQRWNSSDSKFRSHLVHEQLNKFSLELAISGEARGFGPDFLLIMFSGIFNER
jgi:hypothetical protein